MSQFEKITHIDPEREKPTQIEKVEFWDSYAKLLHDQKNPVKESIPVLKDENKPVSSEKVTIIEGNSKDECKIIYKKPDLENLSEIQKQKFELAKKLTEKGFTIKIGDKIEESSTKSTERKSKKVSAKLHKASMESLQKKVRKG